VTAPDAGYVRFIRPIPGGADRARLWQAIGRIEGHVAVNAVDASGAVALLTDASVDALAGQRSVTVEALPEQRFREIAGSKIRGALETATTLRAAWRTRPIGDTASQLQTLLQRLTEIALLASLFARQRRSRAGGREADALVTLAGQLSRSAFHFDDTVRASDDVHHEIIPALQRLSKTLG
jgi:hypothetical protein